MQNLVEFTHFENLILIQKWLTQNMWSINATICIFNNKLQKISFKNSFIWKSEKWLKNTHSPVGSFLHPIRWNHSHIFNLKPFCNHILISSCFYMVSQK